MRYTILPARREALTPVLAQDRKRTPVYVRAPLEDGTRDSDTRRSDKRAEQQTPLGLVDDQPDIAADAN